MREAFGDNSVDIWEMWRAGHWIAVTTNGSIKTQGGKQLARMGAGVAKDAANICPDMPELLALGLIRHGNVLMAWWDRHMLTFPTKHLPEQDSDPTLIEQATDHLNNFLLMNPQIPVIYLPKPGCGLGHLSYENQVRPILSRLPDRVIVTERPRRRRTA